jgi:hypothetical protein
MQAAGADSSSLRIGVLADTIDRPGGIGRYTHELVAAGNPPWLLLVQLCWVSSAVATSLVQTRAMSPF